MSLYIHFPYCLYKCHYCDFNSYAAPMEKIPQESYTLALAGEIEAREALYEKEGKHFFPRGRLLDTLFFGGGTPSLMGACDLEGVINKLSRYFVIKEDSEITLEANPKTVTKEKLAELRRAGINRLSLGVQSLQEAYLSGFGRIHSADEARQAIDWVREAFDVWNVDLIFGFPGQTLPEWVRGLKEVLAFSPPHLSCYALTVEEETPYARMIERGEKKSPDDDLQAEMFEVTKEVLEEKGYHRYEISNYARPGFESRHNLNYWNYGEYAGLGAGAVSFLRNREKSPSRGFGYRTTNFKEPNRYMQALLSNSPHYWFDAEKIDRQTAMSEFMMMGLRLKEGVSPGRFGRLFGSRLTDSFSEALKRCYQSDWLEPEGYALTPKGELFANKAIREFFA